MSMIPKPEHPRPERLRDRWENLNGTWEFALFPEGQQQAEKKFAKERKAYPGEIVVPFSWVSPLSGVEQDVAGIGWYRRRVTFAARGRVFLCFGGVDYLTDVFVNGQAVGTHQGGYNAFELDVTDAWVPGENVIEVRAEDGRAETQTYGKQGYGEIQGIWQTVWLEERPAAHIGFFHFETKISGLVTLSVETTLPKGKKGTLTAAFGAVEYTGQVSSQGTLEMQFPEPKLWSPDSPHLYEGTIALSTGDERDVVETYFGIREIGTAFVQGRTFPWVTLNGEPVYLNGTLDQAFHPTGHFTYPDEESIRDEAWRLKRLGLNMVRIHIKTEEPRKLYWMDKMGVLVMQDVPCFWGPPNEQARAAYEAEWPGILRRDINHPSIFSWVTFNESWGLLDDVKGERTYLPQTQEWVRDVYLRAKALDPTRLVEDNSPCRYDHVQSDLNTWHFYLNGYEVVRDHIRNVVKETYPGSEFNYIGGAKQTAAPLMNSECGMVWGVDDSAGDSDLSWQYHYMLNEYRLHEKICGFIFTEFHDVVNEFNGYYRIDDRDKDFGYQGFCQGMSLRDLHAADFVAIDAPPCQTVEAGVKISLPLVLSSFSPVHQQRGLVVKWELWHTAIGGNRHDDRGAIVIPPYGYGTTQLGAVALTLPSERAVAVFSLSLQDMEGNVVSRNFTTFDVRTKALPMDVEIPLETGESTGFAPAWFAMDGKKACYGGGGEVSYEVELPRHARDVYDMALVFEAGAKRVLQKDRQGETKKEEADLGFMRGYKVNRGQFQNSYFMTDEERFPSCLQVLIDGQLVETVHLQNDWADSRGVLSFVAQPNPRKLDETGSYGERQEIEIPSRLIPGISRQGRFRLTLRVEGQGGLALYGRNCGRYPFGLTLRVRK